MHKAVEHRQQHGKAPQKSDQPSKVTALAELLRIIEQARTAKVSRDYFRANSRIGDKWNLYWPSFKAFLAAASEENDLLYMALVELVAENSPTGLSMTR